MTHKLLLIEIVGTTTAALCCVTPILPWFLSVVGLLSSLTGYLNRDSVLLPLVAFFLVLTGYALWRMKRAR